MIGSEFLKRSQSAIGIIRRFSYHGLIAAIGQNRGEQRPVVHQPRERRPVNPTRPFISNAA